MRTIASSAPWTISTKQPRLRKYLAMGTRMACSSSKRRIRFCEGFMGLVLESNPIAPGLVPRATPWPGLGDGGEGWPVCQMGLVPSRERVRDRSTVLDHGPWGVGAKRRVAGREGYHAPGRRDGAKAGSTAALLAALWRLQTLEADPV